MSDSTILRRRTARLASPAFVLNARPPLARAASKGSGAASAAGLTIRWVGGLRFDGTRPWNRSSRLHSPASRGEPKHVRVQSPPSWRRDDGGPDRQTIAAAGIPVVLKDIDETLVKAGLDEAEAVTRAQVGKLVERGKLTAEQGEQQIEDVLRRIEGTTSYAEFGGVDIVIEAVPERMDIKQSVFAELDAATPGHAILASNTSSLSITEIGDATLRPTR